MKATGIVRQVDDLGRVVLPIELRRVLGIEIKDPLEIYVEDDKIILRKYQPGCSFCGNTENVISFKGRSICADCISAMQEEL